MTELDQLERELLAAADTWFSASLHRKLQRLIEIARGEKPWGDRCPKCDAPLSEGPCTRLGCPLSRVGE
jgi:hypothetical protein